MKIIRCYILILLLITTCTAFAKKSHVTYQQVDSIRIVSLLQQAKTLKEIPHSWMLWFGKKFVNTPYVGGTLERDSEERLVVNTQELDCTTYVEIVLALTMCAERGETVFSKFCKHLRDVRYIDGCVSYIKRQHYFTTWIESNESIGIVKEIQVNPPFTAVQTINVNWMTTHSSSYKMLKRHPEWVSGIRSMEKSINGHQYRYIPKANIANSNLFRNTIHDGDIIVIVTNKKGLDTTHIGVASWHDDGLHLLNASSLRKKVVDEHMTLRAYMLKQPSQIGIRVCRH